MDIEIGKVLEKTKTVRPEDSAMHYGSGMVDVFATPAMVAFMEGCSMELILKQLPEGFNTVGTEVSIKHLKATPVGMEVRCRAEIIEADGRAVLLKVEAFDEDGKIGEGTHRRFIIDVERFMNKLGS